MALALAIGGLGGWLANWAQVPLAWMIGAMTATTVASILGLPIAIPPVLRSVFVAILGVMLGSGFTPEIIDRLPEWGISILVLVVYTAVAGSAGMLYFRWVTGYDRTTAYFAGMPGGLSEMILVGSAFGGDARVISLVHASRVLFVVLTLPFAFQLLLGYEPESRPEIGPALTEIPLVDLALLTASGVVGYFGARLLKLPAAAVVGPMVLSAIVHLAGVTDDKPPEVIVAIAQVVVGTAIGCRFAGTAPAFVVRTVVKASGGTVVLLAVALLFAVGLNAATDLPLPNLMLAYAPGGLAEMSLIAIALGFEAAFVASHHILRIFMIVVAAPLVFRALGWRMNPRPEEEH